VSLWIPAWRAALLGSGLLFSATPTITPTLGEELLTNPGFETADPPSSWTAGNSATLSQVTANRPGSAGTKALNVDNGAAAEGEAYQQVVATAGVWYQLIGWAKQVNAYPRMEIQTEAGAVLTTTGSMSGDWNTRTLIARATTAAVRAVMRNQNATAGPNKNFYADDLSLKALDLASCLALVGDPGRREVTVDSHPTLTTKTQCGHAIWVDSPTNPTYGLFAFHDGTNARIDRLTAGSWDSVVPATAATYVAGAKLRSRVSADRATVTLFYNGVQISVPTAVATPFAYGTKVCGFSTYGGNSTGPITVSVS
jgi:hypothetical protein